MNGTFYANLFVHFQPVGYNEFNKKEREGMKNGIPPLPPHKETPTNLRKPLNIDLDENHQEGLSAVHEFHGGHEQTNHDQAESADLNQKETEETETENEPETEPEEESAAGEEEEDSIPRRIMDRHNRGDSSEHTDEETGGRDGVTYDIDIATEALVKYAQEGDFAMVERICADNNNQLDRLLDYRDENDWSVLHEAVRAGELDVVVFLIEKGADVSAETEGGFTALSLARSILYNDHAIIKYLVSIGAPEGDLLKLAANH